MQSWKQLLPTPYWPDCFLLAVCVSSSEDQSSTPRVGWPAPDANYATKNKRAFCLIIETHERHDGVVKARSLEAVFWPWCSPIYHETLRKSLLFCSLIRQGRGTPSGLPGSEILGLFDASVSALFYVHLTHSVFLTTL